MYVMRCWGYGYGGWVWRDVGHVVGVRAIGGCGVMVGGVGWERRGWAAGSIMCGSHGLHASLI